MTGMDLVPLPEQYPDHRRAALERLTVEAETADAERAEQIMRQGRIIAEALEVARGSFEDARLAGKASVVAARRLGKLLADVSSNPGPPSPGTKGPGPSARRLLSEQLGLSTAYRQTLVRLARVPDPDFQRYIQTPDIIPTLHGALWKCSVLRKPAVRRNSSRTRRRQRLGISNPRNPSIDEAYSLIIRALGHLGALDEGGRDRGRAMQHLYAAEDLLKRYRAGYGKKVTPA